MKTLLGIILILSTLGVAAQPANDDLINAIDVSNIMNSCSADAIYTTTAATGDGVAASCWNTGPTYNVWFSFVATTTQINITVDRGGSQGTVRRVNLALYDTDGTTELSCNRYIGNDDDVITGYTNLTIGQSYYFSVDNNYYNYVGTFSLCLSDAVDYDFIEGAVDISGIINSCSADAAYTTAGATSDQAAGSTWNTSPNYNRWFKFQATASSINVTASRGNTKGTIRRIQLALWDENIAELASNRYVSNDDDVSLGYNLLTIGKWYYISVDNNYYNYRGSFTLCLDDQVDYDFYQGAIDVTSLIGTCSADAAYTTVGATSDKIAGTSWNTSPNYNRWFKFQASTFAMDVTINRGGSLGTIRRVQVAIWEEDGETEVSSKRYVSNDDIVNVGSVNLVPGNWYYISVDNNYYNYRGTFTICLDDQVDYDYYEGAKTLTNLSNWTSADAAYTTVGATSDKNAGSSWNTSPNYNRWFKFQATSNLLNVTVNRGGAYGTIRRIQVALWESDGITEIVSNRYVGNDDNVSINATTLTPGNWYYISVDNNYYNYRGTFSLAINDVPDYDYYEGAIELADINNWCSADAEYSTIGATSDKNAGSTWNTSPNYNRWFKFQAVTDGISVTAKGGGSLGTIRRIQVALWEADGITEVQSNRYVSNDDDVTVDANTLTPGNWYYVSIDNNYYNYRGTFTLCVDDTPSYDYLAGAKEITSVDNWCSADAAFTTVGATSDETAASCWNTSPNYNRWFKFKAIYHTATIDVKTQNAEGTLRRLNIALWDNAGVEVACARYAGNNDDLQIIQAGLTVGQWYYISVDNNYYNYRGTFTLCVNNVSSDQYYAISDGNWNTPSTWSKTEFGPASADVPTSANKVYIKGYAVTVTDTQAAATLDVSIETAATSLTIDGGTAALTISGKMTFNNVGNNFDGSLTSTNGGNLTVSSDLTITRTGGDNLFLIAIQDASSMTVGNDLTWISDGGTTNLNTLNINGSGILTVGNDLWLDYNSGMKIMVKLDNTATLNAQHDIYFDTATESTVEVEINNTATINLSNNMTRNGTPFGILDFNDNSVLIMNTDTYLQTLAANAGSGTDDFTYQNITFNNTKVSSPQITLEGNVNIPGTLTMTSGDLDTNGNTLTLGTSTLNIGTLNHTSGELIGTYEKWINTALSTNYLFPIGTTSDDRQVNITFNNVTSGTLIATFTASAPGNNGLPLVDGATTYYETFTEGFWSLASGNSLSSGDYNISLDATGFSSFAINTSTTVFVRPDNISNWAVAGNASTPIGSTIYRNNLPALDVDFGIVDNSCVSESSAISGDAAIPEYSINQEYFVTETSGYTYAWTVVGGTIDSGSGTNLISVDWGAAIAGSLKLVASYNGCDAPEVTLAVDVYGPIQSNGTGGGLWDTPATWFGGIVPTAVDNVTIQSTDAIIMDANHQIRDLMLEGSLDQNGFSLTIGDDYTVNGTHTSTGDDKVVLSGINTNIGGTGTLNLGGRFQLTGNKFILSTADLTITSGNLFVSNDVTVYNNGTIRLTGELQGGNANSTWENRPDANLYVGGADANALLSTGKLIAFYTNNTIYYNAAGTQSIKVPDALQYYNLTLQGSTSTLLGEIIVLGDLVTYNVFEPNNNNFSVGGDWINNGTFNKGTTTLTLTGTSNQTIGGDFYNVTVNKTLGSVSLSSNLTVTNVLDLQSKNIVLGAFDLIIPNSASGAIINGSATSFIVPTGAGKIIWDVAVSTAMAFPVGDALNYTPFSFILNSGTLAGGAVVNLNLTDGVHPNNASTSYLSRYWTFENTGITTPDYSVSYSYLDEDIVGTEADFEAIKYSGGWTSGGSVTTASNTVNWNNITSFSDFSGGDNVTPLPIELISFDVTLVNEQAQLTWKTASETNNDFFTVERSIDGINFTEVLQVAGAGTSNKQLRYVAEDKAPISGLSFYRLKQTDYDGTFAYSDLAKLEKNDWAQNIILLYPNPNTGDAIYINANMDSSNPIRIDMYSLAGELVYSESVDPENTNFKHQLKIGYTLETGTYLLRFSSRTFQSFEKLVVQ